MPGRFAIEAVFKSIDKVSAPVTRMGNRVSKTLRRIGGGVQRLNAKLKSIAKTAGSAFGVLGIAGALLAVRLAMGAVISKGAEFEQTLVGAAARFPEGIRKGTAAFKELERVARETGATTEFTANEAAGGLNFLAKAGFSAAQSMKLLPGLVDFATASELDLARASDIASDSIGAFGLMTKDAGQLQKNFARISDQMAKTTNSANVNMEQLFETIKKGAPAATAAGVPMETFLALTAQLAGAGLKASDAGTALKNVFLKLADSKVQKKLSRMGVAVKDSAGELRDFADIMDDLNASLEGSSKVTKAGVINDLFGLRGVTAIATVLGQGTEGLRAFRIELGRSEGETKRLATQLRDTLTGELKTLNSAVESITLSFFEVNGTGISGLVIGLTNLARGIDGFVQRNPEIAKLVVLFGVLAAAALLVAVIVAGVAAAIAFVAGSVAAMLIVGGVLGAMFLKWLDPINSVIRGLDILREAFPAFDGALNFLGFDGDGESAGKGAGRVISPQTRQANLLDKSISKSTAELTIKDETGRAELTTNGNAPGVGITLEPTGDF